MYTEEEARTKWCPHIRVAEVGLSSGGGYNRSAEIHGGLSPRKLTNCIASECMAWRSRPTFNWQMIYDALRTGQIIEAIKCYRMETGASLKDAKDAVEAIDLNAPVPQSAQRGFCGLAGAP
jgi:hypothetical protein